MAGRRSHARGDMRASATKNAAAVPRTWLSTNSAMVMSEAWSRIGRNFQATPKSRCMSGHLVDQLRAEVVDAEVLLGPAVQQPVPAHEPDGLVHLGLQLRGALLHGNADEADDVGLADDLRDAGLVLDEIRRRRVGRHRRLDVVADELVLVVQERYERQVAAGGGHHVAALHDLRQVGGPRGHRPEDDERERQEHADASHGRALLCRQSARATRVPSRIASWTRRGEYASPITFRSATVPSSWRESGSWARPPNASTTESASTRASAFENVWRVRTPCGRISTPAFFAWPASHVTIDA